MKVGLNEADNSTDHADYFRPSFIVHDNSDIHIVCEDKQQLRRTVPARDEGLRSWQTL